MNYYEEIKNELVNNEINKKIKHTVSTEVILLPITT